MGRFLESLPLRTRENFEAWVEDMLQEYDKLVTSDWKSPFDFGDAFAYEAALEWLSGDCCSCAHREQNQVGDWVETAIEDEGDLGREFREELSKWLEDKCKDFLKSKEGADGSQSRLL
jgi:cytochrome P450